MVLAREVSPEESVDRRLEALTARGLEDRRTGRRAGGRAVDLDAYRARAGVELAAIRSRGFSGTFLIARDCVRWAREQGIPVGPGWGPSAGSLVAWSLGITDLDPIVEHLLFERFINVERAAIAAPLTITVCARREGEVADHVARTHGRVNAVAVVGLSALSVSDAVEGTVSPAPADPDVYATLARGETEDVPGLEHAGELLRRIQPTCLEALANVLAIDCPAARARGLVDRLVEARHGRHTIAHAHPDVAAVLAGTSGLVVYQAQVMRIAQVVAGYTLDHADAVRRALGRRDVAFVEAERPRFAAAAEARGTPLTIAAPVFDLLARTAGLSQNRSHVLACALLAYRCAYLNHHHSTSETHDV